MKSNNRAKQVKKGKIKMLFFFLLVTSFMWLLTKFSNDFTSTIEADINYIDLPKDRVLLTSSSSKISFDHNSSGFDFLIYKIKKPIITINVNNYYKENNYVTIPQNDLKRIINSELSTNVTVKNISLNEISLHLDSIVSRELPIKTNLNISYQKGFKSTEEAVISPPKIKVSGPSTKINDLNELSTLPINFVDVNTTINGEAEIDTTEIPSLTLSSNTISFSLKVEEFTQKELLVPIQIENLPIGTNIKLIPEFIAVVFDVSISHFNLINKDEFKIVCDYSKRNIEENYMLPQLVESSTKTQNVSLKSQKINYLIFK